MKLIFQKEVSSLKKPSLGSFYIFSNGSIIYNTIGEGLGHPQFWETLVKKSNFFDGLVYENKKELWNAPYGIDRGRVVLEEGCFKILGTEGCKKYLDLLIKIFKLSKQTTFSRDGHYKTQPQDVGVVEDMIRLIGRDVFNTRLNNIVRVV